MEVHFATSRLRRCYEDASRAGQQWGPDVARKYVQRIDLIELTESLEELPTLPGLRWHALSGNLAGRYAVTLTGNYRLILTVVEEKPNTLCVEEVIDYHGD